MRRIYIHQDLNWPDFTWNHELLLPVLASLRHKQGFLRGYLGAIGFEQRNEAALQTLTLDVLKSSEIEGEIYDSNQVRSSIARHLGMDIAGLVPADRNVDGVVEMMLDATQNYKAPLTNDRLFSWHASLFPEEKNGITVGNWRNNEKGPMQVVSGAMGKERVHFEAPEAERLGREMELFLNWFNTENNLDGVLKSAVAHFWFVTIHPFDDGNGRIARAIADMQLTKADGDAQRFFSMSAQIRVERRKYYEMLEKVQKGSLDITPWIMWYLDCLNGALNATDATMHRVLYKTQFWDEHAKVPVNERQRLLMNKLLDGFEGKLTSSKWAKIAKCSPDTALRDINDLITKGVIEKENSGGRSTAYFLK
ncbi:MAG: Fic family protein [Bacteroidia bacterium]